MSKILAHASVPSRSLDALDVTRARRNGGGKGRARRKNPTIVGFTARAAGGKVHHIDASPVARAMYTGSRPGEGGHSTSWIEPDEQAAARGAYARIEAFLRGLPKAELVRILREMGRTAWVEERADGLRTSAHLALYDLMVVPTRVGDRTNGTRKNHHIRPGGTFRTPGGRRGTTLGEARSGRYPVLWGDGTLGTVADAERAARPTVGSRANPRHIVQRGNRAVVILDQGDGIVRAYLYVNARGGIENATITNTTWRGSTLKGAKAWAERQLTRANPATPAGRDRISSVAKLYRGRVGHATDYVEGYGYPVDFPDTRMKAAMVRHLSISEPYLRAKDATAHSPLRLWIDAHPSLAARGNPAYAESTLLRSAGRHRGRYADRSTWWVYTSNERRSRVGYGPYATRTEAVAVHDRILTEHPNWTAVLTRGSPLGW